MEILVRITVLAVFISQAFMGPGTQAGTVYRWTDSQGRTHFSDTEPANRTSTATELEAVIPGAAGGLRPAERATLRRIEQRRKSMHRLAEKKRRQQRRTNEAHRQACSERREQLRLGRRHVDSKVLAKYLRKHCW